MDGVWGLPDGRRSRSKVADDDADRLRRQHRDPREIGAREAGIGLEHRQHHELRRGDAEIGQRTAPSLAAVALLGLAQQIGEIALLAALALALRRRAGAGERRRQGGFFGGFFPASDGFFRGSRFSPFWRFSGRPRFMSRSPSCA